MSERSAFGEIPFMGKREGFQVWKAACELALQKELFTQGIGSAEPVVLESARSLVLRVAMWGVGRTDPGERIKVPLTWWDHFKERNFPGWALRRWPVVYREIVVRWTRVCPHMKVPKDRDHLEFLVRG